MVSVLALYSNNLSSNPAEEQLYLKRTKIKKRPGLVVHLKKFYCFEENPKSNCQGEHSELDNYPLPCRLKV